MKKRIGLLWQNKSLGEYSNLNFDSLYKGVGHNNGNLAFVYSIAKQLGEDIKWYPWHFNPTEIRKEVDIIVIPCANQLGPHTDLGDMATRLEKTDLPIVAIGVGAQAKSMDEDMVLKDGTKSWIEVISRLSNSTSTNIYTRGPYTSEQLGKIGIDNTLAGGCPSHFLADNVHLGRTLEENWNKSALPRSISVAGGHQAWVNTRHLEHQLISLMMDPMFQGKYIVQSMGDMIKISRGLFDEIDSDVLNRIHQHTVPHYSFEEFKRWCLTYATSYYDVPAWMDELRRHDLTVGTRYHGIALGIQAGKMGLTLTIDSRTRELCEQTGVPNIAVADIKEPLTRKSLKSHVKFDGNKYDNFRREKAATYVEFLENNGLEPAKYLYRIVEGK